MEFLVEMWDNQPATTIGAGVAIAVFLGFIFLYSIHISSFLLVIAGDAVCNIFKVYQMIPQRSPREYLRIVRSQSGSQDSNLRPRSPKSLTKPVRALFLEIMT